MLLLSAAAATPMTAVWPHVWTMRLTAYNVHLLSTMYIHSAEGLAADLRPYQQQLITLAQEILVGCDDAIWRVAAPTSCAIICSQGRCKTT